MRRHVAAPALRRADRLLDESQVGVAHRRPSCAGATPPRTRRRAPARSAATRGTGARESASDTFRETAVGPAGSRGTPAGPEPPKPYFSIGRPRAREVAALPSSRRVDGQCAACRSWTSNWWPTTFQPALAQALADAAGAVFGTSPGQTWVRLRACRRRAYAENALAVSRRRGAGVRDGDQRALPAAHALRAGDRRADARDRGHRAAGRPRASMSSTRRPPPAASPSAARWSSELAAEEIRMPQR